MEKQSTNYQSNRYTIPYLPVLDALDLSSNEIALEQNCLRLPIMENNWPTQFPYIPITTADLAYSDTGLYCRFQSKGRGLSAQYKEDGSRVHEDSCVELFLQLPDDDRYYNFEFNVIGTCDASYRKSRTESTPFTPEQYAKVHRTSSERRDVLFNRPLGLHSFFVSVKIELELLGLDPANLPPYILANLYKCGDKTPVPHFASWKPIDTPEPDFHQPRFFTPLFFG